MSTLIARNDAQIVQQVSTLTPAAVTNLATYGAKLNNKAASLYTADASATAQEIVEGVKAIMAAYTAAQFPEAKEVTWTEDDVKVIATGPSTGKPFTVANNAAASVALTVATPTTAKSPNHWIAENFDLGTLPATGDTVYVSQLSSSQSFKYNLDQSAVTLAVLDVRADSEAEAGLPDFNADGTPYYQAVYRETWLKLSATIFRFGDGVGQGTGRWKQDFGTNAVDATVYSTGQSRADNDEAPLQLAGSHAANALQVLSGDVDLAMTPGKTTQWASIVTNGNVRCGVGATLAAVEVGGNGTLETRTALTTAKTRDNGKLVHIGSGGITTSLDIAGGNVEIRATGALAIAQLNGYAGKTLDLSKCDSNVTLTNTTIYASEQSPFTILDPNNKLVMTNPASTPNGSQTLVIKSGSGRNVRIT